MAFKKLNLHPDILKAIEGLGFTQPTPIQEQAVPKVIEGCDLLASAQTGTGKTAAFLWPALNRLTLPSPGTGHGPRVLILVPTRELAMQVAAEATKYSKHLSRVKTVCIYGGAPYPVQIRELSRFHEILVATPGRLIDHMERGRIDFSRLEMFMLDMGFIEPVEQIAEATPKERQTLLFSATLKGNVLKLAKSLLRNPVEVSVAQEHDKHENIDQRLHYVDNISHKHRLLDHLLKDPEINQAIVFTSTKSLADQLVNTLYEGGHNAAALHGDMNQRQRTRTVMRLRKGDIRVLVATAVAARGIDVQTITHVINFDLPNNAEEYVHRIGRTGRAGINGKAMSLVSPKETYLVKQIEQFIGQKITVHVEPGFEATFKVGDSKAHKGPRSGSGPNQKRRSNQGSSYQGSNYQGSNYQGSNYQGSNYQGSNFKPRRSEFSDSPRRSESSDSPKRSEYSDSPRRSEHSDSKRGESRGYSNTPAYSNAPRRSSDRPKSGGAKFGGRSSDGKFDSKPGAKFDSKSGPKFRPNGAGKRFENRAP
jgi:superfamily II DNA/RNA helicase